MNDYELAYIEWIDCSGYEDSRWQHQTDIDELGPMLIHSVGWIVRETKEAATVVPHFGERAGDNRTPNYGGVYCIPKVAIRKRKKLKV